MIPEGEDDQPVSNRDRHSRSTPSSQSGLNAPQFNLESYYHKSIMSRLRKQIEETRSFLDKVVLNRLKTSLV